MKKLIRFFPWIRKVRDFFRMIEACRMLVVWVLTPKDELDEFHSVFESNFFMRLYLPKKLRAWYENALMSERQRAHEATI